MGAYLFSLSSPEYTAANWGSLVGNVLIFCYILWLNHAKPFYASRVSIRLQTGIAFVDIVRHTNLLFSYSTNNQACSVIGFMFYYFYLVNTYLNVAIALNLYLVHIKRTFLSHFQTKLLYVGPFLAAFVINLVPIILGAYGKAFEGFCGIKSQYAYRDFIKALILFISNYPGLLFCFIVPVMIRLKSTKPKIDSVESQDLATVEAGLLRHLVLRVSLYPMACFFCHMGEAINALYISINGRPSIFLLSWADFGLSINGAVNSICFFLDPFVLESFYAPSIHSLEHSNEDFEFPLDGSLGAPGQSVGLEKADRANPDIKYQSSYNPDNITSWDSHGSIHPTEIYKRF